MTPLSLRRFLSAAGASLALACGSAFAVFDPVNDDTDIFLANPNFTATRPNVLIFIDNTSNWGQSASGTTKYDAVRTALNAVMNGVVTDNFNVGMALFVETGSPNNNADGAYIRYGIRQMTTANKLAFTTMVTGLDKTGDAGNGAVYSLAMGEMYRYFAGVTSSSGHDKNKIDAGGYIYSAGSRVALAGSPLPQAALPTGASPTPVGTGSASTYTSPIVDGCQKNFIIIVSNGEASDNSSSLTAAETHLTSIMGAAPATIPLSDVGEQGLWVDEYAQFMANSDCNASLAGVQNVYTYTIDVLPKSTGQGPAHSALLESTASVGKGKYFKITDISNTSQIEAAFTTIFQEVQSVNSVFASTTLPVSVNVRGTNLNQVYVGIFRPDSSKKPRWFGNLKLYKFALNSATKTIFLADADGVAAENAATGFVSTGAKSFWTTTSSFWSYRTAAENGTGGSSDLPDGDLVEKGGAAQRLREVYPTSQATRKLYTCTSAAASGLCADGDLLSATPFDTATVSAGEFGAYTTYTVTSISSSGTTATAVLSGTPSPAWSLGANTVTISGASPTVYNGTYSVDVTSLSPVTFTYTLASAPASNKARVTITNHGLVAGDKTCVSAGDGFYSCNSPYPDITRIDANTFEYPATPTAANPSWVSIVYGAKLTNSVYGFAGQSIGYISIPNHGFGSAGATVSPTWLLTANESWAAFYGGTSTIVDSNTLSFPTNGTVSGTATKAYVNSVGHGLSTGMTATIAGSSVTGFNASFSITKLDANNFTIDSTTATTANNAGITIGYPITSITHPTTGSGNGATSSGDRDTATVTLSTALPSGIVNGSSINILGSSGTYSGGSGSTAYNGSWVIQSIAADRLSFTIFHAAIDQLATPVSTAGMVAGWSVTSITPLITATGTINFFKQYTPTPATSQLTSLTNASGTIIAGRPADADTTVRDNIVNWVRGLDNIADSTDDSNLANVRSGIHGDVLHSRPAVINYNRYGNDNDVYVFYGGNDGVFRGLKGGFGSDEAGVSAGDERWGFVPKEFFTKLSRLRSQSPLISNVNQKDYFWDGSTGVYSKDGNSDGKLNNTTFDKVYLYPAIRRGGKFLYALNVTTPDAPKLLWRKDNTSTGWTELGQMWSEPKVTRSLASLGNAANPDNVVLVFGAGYDDTVDDINPCLLDRFDTTSVRQKALGSGAVTYTAAGSCTISGATGTTTTVNRTKGRGIMVVDAFSGTVVWQAGAAPTGATYNLTVPGMDCAIPSDVSILDKNRDGIGDRAYVGDVCGNVWRVDMSTASFSTWRVTKIAAFSGTDNTVITDKIKFLFPPDLVVSTDGSGIFTAVLLGSGDREHPFDTTVQNAFFMIKDRDSSDPTTPSMGAPNSTTRDTAGAITGATGSAATKSTIFNATSTNVDSADAKSNIGWYIDLLAGEKNVGGSVTIGGTTFFATNQPSASAGGGSCGSNLGIARTYLVDYETAGATKDLNSLGTLSVANRSTIVAGGGYLPTPVPAIVDPTNTPGGGGTPYQIVCFGIHCVPPSGVSLNTRVRTYWYKEVE
jgi:type IV pilus assembly protein PilY1